MAATVVSYRERGLFDDEPAPVVALAEPLDAAVDVATRRIAFTRARSRALHVPTLIGMAIRDPKLDEIAIGAVADSAHLANAALDTYGSEDQG